jgi:hypothetical protein
MDTVGDVAPVIEKRSGYGEQDNLKDFVAFYVAC